MRIIFAFIFSLVTALVSAQSNFSSLDTLFNTSLPPIFGIGGGATVVLVRDGKTIYDKSFGNFSKDKAVAIASASKWYAGVLMMKLADEGILDLNDKVSKYIPSFKGEKEAITIAQCFSLTSGFPGSSETLDEFMGNRRQSFAEMVDMIAEKPLVAKPGEQLNYGGLAMQVAGRIAEIVTGKNWNTLFKEKVAEPLQLTNTYWGGSSFGFVPRIAGGVISTASDYLKLLDMISNNGMSNGKRFLSEKSVRYMLSDQTGKATIGYSPFTKYKSNMQTSKDARYGIGNWVIAGIDNVTVNTSPGAFGFTPWIDREHHYVGVIAIRSAFPKVMPVFWKAVHLINNEFDKQNESKHKHK